MRALILDVDDNGGKAVGGEERKNGHGATESYFGVINAVELPRLGCPAAQWDGIFVCSFYASCGEVLVNRQGAKDAKKS